MTNRSEVVSTSLGQVEVAQAVAPDSPCVLLFPGGHSTAATPTGADLYTDLGYRVISVSRPGYGRTDVGPLMAAEFMPAVVQSCAALGIEQVAAVVGISFGGLQAVHAAAALGPRAGRLILHSAAPSSLPYPDHARDRRMAPVVFSPRSQGLTWRAVRRLTARDAGLRMMFGELSTKPLDQWWDTWTDADKASASSTFSAMESGAGFMLDVEQGRPERSDYRRSVMASVAIPTLITASRHDGGVDFAHAEDFAATIPSARLVETESESHFFWLGPHRADVGAAIRSFLEES